MNTRIIAVFSRVTLRGHNPSARGFKSEMFFFQRVAAFAVKCLAVPSLVIPLASDPLVDAEQTDGHSQKNHDFEQGFEPTLLQKGKQHQRPHKRQVGRLGEDGNAGQCAGEYVRSIGEQK